MPKTIKLNAAACAPKLVIKVKVVGLRSLIWRVRAALKLIEFAQWVAGRAVLDVEGRWVDRSEAENLLVWAHSAVYAMENGESPKFAIARMKEAIEKLKGGGGD